MTEPRPEPFLLDPARREMLWVAGAIGCSLLVPNLADAAELPPEMRTAVTAFARGTPVREGRVTMDIAELVENGNAVPVSVAVQGPMTAADHVVAIGIFNERNPQPDVAVFQLSPRSGRAQVSTRIRLATSQKLVAVARMADGSCWSKTVDVIVTIAACIETE